MGRVPPRPVKASNTYTFNIGRDLKKLRRRNHWWGRLTRPYWATITVGIFNIDEIILRDHTVEGLLRRCWEWAANSSLRRGNAEDPQVRIQYSWLREVNNGPEMPSL